LLLLGINIGLVASTLVSFWIRQSVPGFLAISCGIVGGVTFFSRYKVWKTGTAKYFYDLTQDDPKAQKKLRIIDLMFWAAAGYNLVLFLGYVAMSYWDLLIRQ
jgi:hypothetical protein